MKDQDIIVRLAIKVRGEEVEFITSLLTDDEPSLERDESEIYGAYHTVTEKLSDKLEPVIKEKIKELEEMATEVFEFNRTFDEKHPLPDWLRDVTRDNATEDET